MSLQAYPCGPECMGWCLLDLDKGRACVTIAAEDGAPDEDTPAFRESLDDHGHRRLHEADACPVCRLYLT